MAIALEKIGQMPLWRKINYMSELVMGDVWVIAGAGIGGIVTKSYPTQGDIYSGKLYTCKPPAA